MSSFDQVIWQFIWVCGGLWKMRGEHISDFLNRLDQRVTELLVLKMCPHFLDNGLPKLLAAFFVNRLVANDGELVSAWRYEDQNRITLLRPVHTKLMKLLLRCNYRVGV